MAMPTLMQYAAIAQEVYRPFSDGETCRIPEFGCNPGFCLNDKPASLGGSRFSTGLQGRVFFHGGSNTAIIAFKGTAPDYDDSGKPMLSDFVNDLILSLPLLVPPQVAVAIALVASWKKKLQGYRLALTGHSLGGAIVQVVGVTHGIKFVGFNGPNSWGAGGFKAIRNSDSNGVNYILNDFIGRRFIHCGRVVNVPAPGHGMKQVLAALKDHRDCGKDPIA
jgi:hypothetical protein